MAYLQEVKVKGNQVTLLPHNNYTDDITMDSSDRVFDTWVLRNIDLAFHDIQCQESEFCLVSHEGSPIRV